MENRGKTSNPGYEIQDTNVGGVFFLLGLLFTVLGVVMALALGTDRLLRRFSTPERPQSPLAKLRRVPPVPRLQINSAVEMTRHRDIEDVALNHYGWIDHEREIVRLPIDEAMRQMVRRGLPARHQDKADEP
jgi:hypothetical protein